MDHMGDRQMLLRSHSRRTSRATDTNPSSIHGWQPDHQAHKAEHRASNLIRTESHGRRQSQSRGLPLVKVHPAGECSIHFVELSAH